MKLFSNNISMASDGDFAELNVHDAGSLEIVDFLEERHAHAADLMLFAFGENHAERMIVDDANLAWQGFFFVDLHSRFHLRLEA